MDLGIRGRNAIVCASSRGLSKACAMSLAREGVNLTLMARTKDAHEAAAKEIRDATGVRVTAVAGNVTINNLVPGPFDTDRLRSTIAIQAKTSGRTVEVVVRDRRRTNPAGRFGEPAEFGELCAFVCGAHAGFMTGQNFLIDGGTYPGSL